MRLGDPRRRHTCRPPPARWMPARPRRTPAYSPRETVRLDPLQLSSEHVENRLRGLKLHTVALARKPGRERSDRPTGARQTKPHSTHRLIIRSTARAGDTGDSEPKVGTPHAGKPAQPSPRRPPHLRRHAERSVRHRHRARPSPHCCRRPTPPTRTPSSPAHWSIVRWPGHRYTTRPGAIRCPRRVNSRPTTNSNDAPSVLTKLCPSTSASSAVAASSKRVARSLSSAAVDRWSSS